MEKQSFLKTGIVLITILLAVYLNSCTTKVTKSVAEFEKLVTNINGKGVELDFNFEKGSGHNHPTMAVWIETMDEEYVQTLFVTDYIATGIFGHGQKSDSTWLREKGPAVRPAALPYWGHKRGVKSDGGYYIPTPSNPVPDAYTGATPNGSFYLTTKSDKPVGNKFRVLIEINQTWDFNEYWTSTKFSDNKNYKTSCQPSLIYAVTVDLDNVAQEYFFNPIGHGHYAGEDGTLYTDLSTFTTALNIFKSIKLTVNQ